MSRRAHRAYGLRDRARWASLDACGWPRYTRHRSAASGFSAATMLQLGPTMSEIQMQLTHLQSASQPLTPTFPAEFVGRDTARLLPAAPPLALAASPKSDAAAPETAAPAAALLSLRSVARLSAAAEKQASGFSGHEENSCTRRRDGSKQPTGRGTNLAKLRARGSRIGGQHTVLTTHRDEKADNSRE